MHYKLQTCRQQNQIWLVYKNYKSWSWILNYQSFDSTVFFKSCSSKKKKNPTVVHKKWLCKMELVNLWMPYSIIIISIKSSWYEACRANNILIFSRVGIILDAKTVTLTWKKNRQRSLVLITLITVVMEKQVFTSVRTSSHALGYQKGQPNLRFSAIKGLLLYLYFMFVKINSTGLPILSS